MFPMSLQSLLVTELMKIYLILKWHDLSISALIAWILSACFNIHTLKLELPKQPIELHNQIARLKKLKELDVSADDASELKEVTLIAFRIMTTLLTSS
jgi:hypothetical protein